MRKGWSKDKQREETEGGEERVWVCKNKKDERYKKIMIKIDMGA